uniref:Peptidase M13 N-terminal domain-containing protein n=1 Tax=Panagrolaimus davidi TaxID=227884 RepID=A0A914PKP6_9BILA
MMAGSGIFLLAIFVAIASATPRNWGSYAVNNSQGYQDAAKLLLSGLDFTVDPCVDFYQFSCNTFLKNATIPPGATRIGTYDQSQQLVNSQIATAIGKLDSSASITEKITARGFNSCMQAFNAPPSDLSSKINTLLLSQIGGLPMITVGWKEMDWGSFWQTVGKYESQYGVGSIFSSYVSVDYGHTNQHALYINQVCL